MKRCSQCGREYDNTMSFCLDDGAELVYGPAADEQTTAILSNALTSSESPTKTFGKNHDPANNTTAWASRKSVIIALAAVVVLLTALGAVIYLSDKNDPSKQVDSIAVMPFVNESSNPDIEYLADGITESLINSLSQIPALSVKARSSVFSYKGKDISVPQIARELSVEAVLKGRVAQRGDQVFMNVELVDAGSGNQLWGDQYVRKTGDVVQLQTEIARDVSSKLRDKLTGAEQQKITKNYTDNAEAYRLYLLGRYHWNKRTSEDVRKSIDYFQQAIDKDPTYALAYGALAEGYVLFPNYGMGSARESGPKARAAAARAIEIDPNLPEAHNAMAAVLHGYEWKFAEAEAEWKKTLDLNPNYATARQWYSEYLTNMGRYKEALAEMRRARELDPLSLIINGLFGMALQLDGQHEAALDQLEKTRDMDPNFPRVHFFLSTVYHAAGRYEDAVDEFAKGAVLNGAPPDNIEALAAKVKNAARAGGEKAYSRAMAEAMESSGRVAGVPAPFLAGLWARAGETDKAFDILEKAYRERDDTILMMKGPGLDPLKSDPRYADLLRRIGLPAD